MSLCRLENSAIEKLFFVIIVKAVVVEGICFCFFRGKMVYPGCRRHHFFFFRGKMVYPAFICMPAKNCSLHVDW